MPHVFLPVLAFAAAWGVLVLTPGTETALIIRLSISVGRATAIGAVLGIAAGLTLWGIGTAFGLSALIAASHTLYLVLEWACAGYLLSLAFRLVVNVLRSTPETETDSENQAPKAFWSGFRRGMFTTILNPLVGVFDLTAFPQFIPPDVNAVTYALLLTVVQAMLTLTWYFTLAFTALFFSRFLANPVVIRVLDGLTALVFVIFAIRLVISG